MFGNTINWFECKSWRSMLDSRMGIDFMERKTTKQIAISWCQSDVETILSPTQENFIKNYHKPRWLTFLARNCWDGSKFESFLPRIQFLFEFWVISEFSNQKKARDQYFEETIRENEWFEFWTISKSDAYVGTGHCLIRWLFEPSHHFSKSWLVYDRPLLTST